MATINIPRSNVRVKYINAIMSGSDSKAEKVLHSVVIPPYIPYSNMVTVVDLAPCIEVSTSALKSALHIVRSHCKAKEVFRKVSPKVLNLDPEDECTCQKDTVVCNGGYKVYRNHAIDGECNVSHIPIAGREFLTLTPKAILITAMFVGKMSSIAAKIRNAIENEYSEVPEPKAIAEAPVMALPAPPEVLDVVPNPVPCMEAPVPIKTESVSISLEVPGEKPIVVTPQMFEYMVKACANIIR